jgi:hypothetical protein
MPWIEPLKKSAKQDRVKRVRGTKTRVKRLSSPVRKKSR